MAVRDLDALPGGAEKSLSTLLLGLKETDPNWHINVYQSNDRTRSQSFKSSSLVFEKCDIKIEDFYSGLAWKFRNRKTGRNSTLLRKIHLKNKNKLFFNWLKIHFSNQKVIAKEKGEFVLGVTQLDWSAGAALAFIEEEIPYVTFVRDEVCFEHPELFRKCLENAHTVIVAGEGLATQVREKFSIKSTSVVHLPIDFEKIIPQKELNQKLETAQAFRLKNKLTNPRIAVVGMVPEKGFEFYNKNFLPKLKTIWPEATVHVYGGGTYSKRLAKHPNTFDEGYCNQKEIFPFCDIHMFRLDRIGTWGRVINEAGYFSIPSISIDIGAQSEAVGKGGIVMPNNSSAEEWINEMKNMYDNLEIFGKLAFEHKKIVDHRTSIIEFISVINGVLND